MAKRGQIHRYGATRRANTGSHLSAPIGGYRTVRSSRWVTAGAACAGVKGRGLAA
jgi:hypothetical protein